MQFSTKLIHSGVKPDPVTGAILPPIYQTATYVLEEVGKNKGFDYTRSSNPTRQALEECLAAVEGGQHATAFASGMAASDSILRLLAAGDHVVCGNDVYGGVTRLFDQILCRFGVTVSYVDTTDIAAVEQAIKENTRLIWAETPSNPLLKVCDVTKLAQISKTHNLLLVVDSTFATPYLLKPLALGADIVLHSTTKFISGHNQIIGGVCITDNVQLHSELKLIQRSIGAVPSPFDCWLTLIGVRTLALRMEKHCENALTVAKYLLSHPKVNRVFYPGLPADPGYQIAVKQMSGFGGVLSFELNGGVEAGRTLMNSLELCALAESLGAVETMITHPATMTHAAVPREQRLQRGLSDGLVRLSVGIENVEDIICDLERGLSGV